MLTLQGEQLALYMREDGMAVILEDRQRGQRWRLDEASRLAAREVPRENLDAFAAPAAGSADRNIHALGPGRAERVAPQEILAVHDTPAGRVRLRWSMERDRVRVRAEAEAAGGATALALPGTFEPEEGAGFLAAIPNGQGLLHTGKGPAFHKALRGGGHGHGCTLSMFGQWSSRGALVSIAETPEDAVLHWEKTPGGAIRLMWLHLPCMGSLGYTRETVLQVSAPDLTAVCKTYRRYVKEKGRFKSWEEKIAERPILEHLFGAAIIFTGYHQDPELDFAGSLRRLKALGIDKAYVYPVYMGCALNPEQSMGVRLADYRAHLSVLKELGYAAGSFIYIVDGAPEGRGDEDLLLNEEGKPQVGWRIKDVTWHVFSAQKRRAWAERLLEAEHKDLQGVHFDVMCSKWLIEDYHPGHRADARQDLQARAEILQAAGRRGLLVSSEGFWDRMTPFYDLGNSKYAQALGGDEYCVVPMTMLVFHDSAYHTWWEVDNYNNPEHRSQSERGYRPRMPWGGGFARAQAAMDALMGTPPDLFPFGMQYCFVPRNHPDIYVYKYRLDEAAVREAIALARPVMELNRRVGKLELVAHKLHRPDGALQETRFADGTRVAANFANVALEAPGVGCLPPESWKRLD